jgi:hypothetical protein
MKLSTTEWRALEVLRLAGGSILVSYIPDKNTIEVRNFDDVTPGMAVYKKLDKKGLVVICDPLVDEDGFEWTPAVEWTPEGKALAMVGYVE